MLFKVLAIIMGTLSVVGLIWMPSQIGKERKPETYSDFVIKCFIVAADLGIYGHVIGWW